MLGGTGRDSEDSANFRLLDLGFETTSEPGMLELSSDAGSLVLWLQSVPTALNCLANSLAISVPAVPILQGWTQIVIPVTFIGSQWASFLSR